MMQRDLKPTDKEASASDGPIVPELSVCHVISGDRWAGAEAQVAALMRSLSRREDLCLSAIVLNEGRLANELRASEVDVCVIPESSNNVLQILRKAKRFARSRRVDILHSHRYKENVLALLLARLCNVPTKIRTQHGLPEPFKGIRALRHCMVQWLDRLGGRRWSDTIISVSAEMMPILQEIYGAHAVLVRNGIDTSLVRSELNREQAKRKLHMPEHVPLIGLVGRLEAIKRVDLFLKAAHILCQRLPSAQFVIAGGGSLEDELKSLAASMGLLPRVRFLGHRDDIFDILRALDVLVMSSDHEGLPMVLLEALWLGVPVAGRNVGGIREALGDDQCGLTVDSSRAEDIATACQRLIEDKALCDRLASAAKERIQKEFSVEKAAEAVASEYRRAGLRQQLSRAPHTARSLSEKTVSRESQR
jgi:L-malate glycosyltransferase